MQLHPSFCATFCFLQIVALKLVLERVSDEILQIHLRFTYIPIQMVVDIFAGRSRADFDRGISTLPILREELSMLMSWLRIYLEVHEHQ